MKQLLTLVSTLVAVGSSSAALTGTALAGTTRDHRDSGASSNSGSSNSSPQGTSSGPVERDHRDTSPAPTVRDHRTSESAPTDSSSTPTTPRTPTYEYQSQSNDYQVSNWSGTNAHSSTGPNINWARARLEVDTFVRRVSAIDSTAGVGVRVTGDITPNLYVGIELASGVPRSDEMNTNAMFRQAGVVAGVRGKVLPRFTIGVESALGIQEFRDVTTVLDVRVKAEQQVASNISLGIYGGRNVNADRDVFAGLNLVFHSSR